MCLSCIVGVMTRWYSNSGSRYSPYMRGGMQYNNGIVTVPTRGLYYVYVQMYFFSSSSSSNYKSAQFCVAINSSCQFYSYTYTQDYGDYYTLYSGRTLLLGARDQLSVSVISTNYYQMNSALAFFGAFRIP